MNDQIKSVFDISSFAEADGETVKSGILYDWPVLET